MIYTISVKRQKNAEGRSYFAVYEYEADGRESVATMLEKLNAGLEEPIGWQCSCLQKKCGACAMVINGVPRLACSTFLEDTGRKIKLEPLSKFPVIRDLIVDRSFIFDQLKAMKIWTDGKAPKAAASDPLSFKAAACLMCGCCLEVCPNFSPASGHMGAIGMANAYRVERTEDDAAHVSDLKKAYTEKVFNTCGKSFSCIDVCPKGLPIEELMVKNIRSL